MRMQRQKISKEYQMKFFKAYIDTCIAIERERDIFEMKSKENANLDEQVGFKKRLKIERVFFILFHCILAFSNL